jgi:predicted adenine nucleotide alpha hydrolase (AANH) superfamily ATPase
MSNDTMFFLNHNLEPMKEILERINNHNVKMEEQQAKIKQLETEIEVWKNFIQDLQGTIRDEVFFDCNTTEDENNSPGTIIIIIIMH